MEKETKRAQLWEEWDGEYMGNIWGWKFSMVGLGLIVFLSLLIWYRYRQLDEKIKKENPIETLTEKDSSLIGDTFYPVKNPSYS